MDGFAHALLTDSFSRSRSLTHTHMMGVDRATVHFDRSFRVGSTACGGGGSSLSSSSYCYYHHCSSNSSSRSVPFQIRRLVNIIDTDMSEQQWTLELTLAVIAAATGAVAILGLLIFCMYSCRQPSAREQRNKLSAPTTGLEVEPGDTSSIESAAENGPVAQTTAAAFRQTTRSESQSTIYENFGRTLSAGAKSYAADDDFDDVWSYAMTEDEGVLVVSNLQSSSDDDEDQYDEERGIEIPTGPTVSEASTPTVFAQTIKGRSLYEV